MVTKYMYQRKELGSREVGVETPSGPQNWSSLPDGEKIRLCPTPDDPYAANKNGDFLVVRGDGGRCLDRNHESEITQDPIAGETRKVRMRCQ